MPTSKVHPARSVVPAAKASAKKPGAAKAKTSNSPSAGKGLPRKAKTKAAKRPSRDVNEKPAATKPKGAPAKPALLAGGNPQIAKADGDAPVQAYIAAMPGWKSDVGRRLDALIVRNVPGVRKAVRWNSPSYGIEGPALDSPHRASHDRWEQRVSQSETRRVKGQGWFLSFHCFAKYVKVGFFRGTSLRPLPPGESKQKEVRYLDIHEDDQLDEAQLASWVKQASQLPGWGGA